MINFLMESEKDITLLTCKECAFEIYKTLSKYECGFVQSEKRIIEEIADSNKVVGITKIVTNDWDPSIYLVFEMEDEILLNNRVVVIDSCVDEYIDKERIPSSSTLIAAIEIEEEDEECCDECMVVEEIINDESIETLEEVIKEAYRRGRESALVELIDEVAFMLYE